MAVIEITGEGESPTIVNETRKNIYFFFRVRGVLHVSKNDKSTPLCVSFVISPDRCSIFEK